MFFARPISCNGQCQHSFVRTFVLQIEKGRTEQKEAEEQKVAKQVAEANLLQIQTLVRRDMQNLQEKLPGAVEQATESALDMKYLRDRQLPLGHEVSFLGANLSKFLQAAFLFRFFS